jgi:hypothetical protein
MSHNAIETSTSTIAAANMIPAGDKQVTNGMQHDENIVTQRVEENRISETGRFFNLFKGIDLNKPSIPGKKFNSRFNPFRYASGRLDALRSMPLDILRSDMVFRIIIYDHDDGVQVAGYEVPRGALKTFKVSMYSRAPFAHINN